MSFSHNIKDELARHVSSSKHCQIAELAALYRFLSKDLKDKNRIKKLIFKSDNEVAVKKIFTLLKKTFNMYKDLAWEEIAEIQEQSENSIFSSEEALGKINEAILSPQLIEKSCCKRAYLRGAFLAAGSISDPEKSYHLEYVCQDEEDAAILKECLNFFEIEAKEFERKNSFVVYIKDGSQIVETLNVMNAHVAMMEFENMRILREMRNSVNRQVNCETANINKTVSAAQKMIDEITFLMGTKEYKGLPKELKEIAKLRINNPEASLAELGELCNPVVGKSGVNHRLRKLSEMATKLKGGKL